MYYTRPTDSETMVSGTSQYAVTVPNVYDFDTDPDNLLTEARNEFEKEYPGQAFDRNTQLAYVTTLAAEKGYEMTVAKWGDRTRAQTTLELKPTDVQITEGNKVIEPFDSEYVSNTDKGYESVVPAEKADKLKDLFNDIYKERNKQSKYDDLYRLPEEGYKYSEQELSDLIMKSDISDDIKNKFQEIVSAPVEKRRSVKKQIIGKNAKLSQDVRDNLEVAKQMESDNKDAKTIRSAIFFAQDVVLLDYRVHI